MLPTARRQDGVDGIQFNRFRHYQAEFGRWNQWDPIRYGDGPNMYGYVGNNPVVFVDLLGMAGVTGWGRNALNNIFGPGIGNTVSNAGLWTGQRLTAMNNWMQRWRTQSTQYWVNRAQCSTNFAGSGFNYGMAVLAANFTPRSLGSLAALGFLPSPAIRGRAGFHGAHHSFPVIGRANHYQINIWRQGVSGSGFPIRIPIP